MKLLFRTDASLVIGTGHMTRCLTLAKQAKKRGANVCFVTRDSNEYVANLVLSEGYALQRLQTVTSDKHKTDNDLAHVDWLAVSQETDAMQTLQVFYEFRPDWVIVDHYSINYEWHKIFKKNFAKIMVIDDLGDRQLSCDILLDQNLGACKAKYNSKVPNDSNLLMGPQFALLRDEFKDWREQSIKDRTNRKIKEVLITMGGADVNNYTTKVLLEILKSEYSKVCNFTVIVGQSYPHLTSLNALIKSLQTPISLLQDTSNMASIMSKSDLCIGAAGSTSWERCCLGLPTITLAIADNQIEILKVLEKNDITIASSIEKLRSDFESFFNQDQELLLKRLSINSASVCDGHGVQRVLDHLENENVKSFI